MPSWATRSLLVHAEQILDGGIFGDDVAEGALREPRMLLARGRELSEGILGELRILRHQLRQSQFRNPLHGYIPALPSKSIKRRELAARVGWFASNCTAALSNRSANDSSTSPGACERPLHVLEHFAAQPIGVRILGTGAVQLLVQFVQLIAQILGIHVRYSAAAAIGRCLIVPFVRP